MIIYDFFPVADSKGLDMGAKERRHHLRGHCEDVVTKILDACKVDHNVSFCMPWDAIFHDFISEEEKIAREVVKQGDREIDSKFATIEALKLMCDRVINSSSKVTSGAQVHPHGPIGVPAPELGKYARIVSGSSGSSGLPAAAYPELLGARANGATFRDRSSSAAKRKRVEEQSSPVGAGTQGQPQHEDPPGTPAWNHVGAGGRKGHKAQKFVIGSGVRDSAGNARRMKTTRADVFVYAVFFL